ncbi:hypothetical protein RFI_25099, partial [Reticulomyxa filosa]
MTSMKNVTYFNYLTISKNYVHSNPSITCLLLSVVYIITFFFSSSSLVSSISFRSKKKKNLFFLRFWPMCYIRAKSESATNEKKKKNDARVRQLLLTYNETPFESLQHLIQVIATDVFFFFRIVCVSKFLFHKHDKKKKELFVQPIKNRIKQYRETSQNDNEKEIFEKKEKNKEKEKAKEAMMDGFRNVYEADPLVYELADNFSSLSNESEKWKEGVAWCLDELSQIFPDLSSVHYYNYNRNLYAGEYLKTLSCLHQYFDYCSSSFDSEWVAFVNHPSSNTPQAIEFIQEKGKKLQYALLARAMFYYHFGHSELALQQLSESIERAQNLNDNKCVGNALFMLSQFLQEQSSNPDLVKSILENCIRNGDTTVHVHCGSLIRLAQWHLDHNTCPHHIWEFLRLN